jgi:hypothetical protein
MRLEARIPTRASFLVLTALAGSVSSCTDRSGFAEPRVAPSAAALHTVNAGSHSVIDQVSTDLWYCNGGTSPAAGYRFAQTFTVGIAGTLGRVELELLSFGTTQGSAIISLYPVTASGTPDLSSPIASTTIPASVIDADYNAAPGGTDPAGWPAADFSGAGLSVTPGEKLALIVSTTDAQVGWIGGGNYYAGGQGYIVAPNNQLSLGCGPSGFHFRTNVIVPDGATPTGSNVSVTPQVTLPDGSLTSVSLAFDQVSSSGVTTVTSSSTGNPPPSGFRLTNPPVYYDITTTAAFSGSVRVCLSWSEGQIANENNVRLFHYESGRWNDITDGSSLDPVNNIVCGTAASLSPFTLFEVQYPFSGFFQPVDPEPTVNTVKAGAAVPVRFSLGGDQGMSIFWQGYPRSVQTQCISGALVDVINETVTAGASSLSYDGSTKQYTYVWKTDKTWANSCRQLQLRLTDGEVYTARFNFSR